MTDELERRMIDDEEQVIGLKVALIGALNEDGHVTTISAGFN